MMSSTYSQENSLTGLMWLIHAWFIVPMSQVKIFDLPYQLYTFEIFHMFGPNRWSHFIGIPISLAATYILLSPLPYGPEIALFIVAGIQVIICLRARYFALIPIVLIVHALLWAVSMLWLRNYLVFDGAWWMHPAFHVVFWPTLQYITHALERRLPPPWSGGDDWMPIKAFLKTAS
ncbi:MAG TPA: hypothetical protein ENK31_01770, partial [Nannocystis exedens]|nr:hypothetical protein [Nannocystis exedens]